MTQNEIVIIVIALALAIAAIGFFWFRRGQRVDMTPADTTLAPTLRRDAPPRAVSLPNIAALPPDGNELRQLKGVGPKLVTRLGELGITRFEHLATLDEDGIAALDAQLGAFAGRIRRDNWVEQAGFLARGDVAAFEDKYGKLDGESAPS